MVVHLETHQSLKNCPRFGHAPNIRLLTLSTQLAGEPYASKADQNKGFTCEIHFYRMRYISWKRVQRAPSGRSFNSQSMKQSTQLLRGASMDTSISLWSFLANIVQWYDFNMCLERWFGRSKEPQPCNPDFKAPLHKNLTFLYDPSPIAPLKISMPGVIRLIFTLRLPWSTPTLVLPWSDWRSRAYRTLHYCWCSVMILGRRIRISWSRFQ